MVDEWYIAVGVVDVSIFESRGKQRGVKARNTLISNTTCSSPITCVLQHRTAPHLFPFILHSSPWSPPSMASDYSSTLNDLNPKVFFFFFWLPLPGPITSSNIWKNQILFFEWVDKRELSSGSFLFVSGFEMRICYPRRNCYPCSGSSQAQFYTSSPCHSNFSLFWLKVGFQFFWGKISTNKCYLVYFTNPKENIYDVLMVFFVMQILQQDLFENPGSHPFNEVPVVSIIFLIHKELF